MQSSQFLFTLSNDGIMHFGPTYELCIAYGTRKAHANVKASLLKVKGRKLLQGYV